MSDGASGWRGIPPNKRHCHACKEKIVLKTAGPLWFAEGPFRVYHFKCALNTLTSPGLDSVRQFSP